MGISTMSYEVIIEEAGANWFAHVPELPGCMATGDTIEEAGRNIRSAIQSHLQALKEIAAETEPQ